MKFYISRLIFEKYSDTKFNENSFSGSRVVPCFSTDGRTDGHNIANSRFSKFANEPNNLVTSQNILVLYFTNCWHLHDIQGVAFNVTHFESRITHLLYTAINTTEHGLVSQCLGFTKKKLHVFNTTSWRCPPWQSRHCCHLPGTLAMTRRRVSCVTFAISWRIAFLRLLMSGRVWVKTWAFKYPHKKMSAAVSSGELEVSVRVHHLLATTNVQRFVRSS